MPPFASRLHPGDRGFKQLPGSIFVPVWVSYGKSFAVSSAYIPPARISIIEHALPASGADLIRAATSPHNGPFHPSVPRLRGFVKVAGGAGSVVVKVMIAVGPASVYTIQKETAILTAAGTAFEFIDEMIYARYMTLMVTVTVNTAAIDACFGLIYGPD